MASHLTKSPFELTVWNRTRSKADDFSKEFGGSVADTPVEAVRGAEIVFTCLPSSREVGDVWQGPTEFFPDFRRARLSSTAPPVILPRLASLPQ